MILGVNKFLSRLVTVKHHWPASCAEVLLVWTWCTLEWYNAGWSGLRHIFEGKWNSRRSRGKPQRCRDYDCQLDWSDVATLLNSGKEQEELQRKMLHRIDPWSPTLRNKDGTGHGHGRWRNKITKWWQIRRYFRGVMPVYTLCQKNAAHNCDDNFVKS